jgi:hypothetical protein
MQFGIFGDCHALSIVFFHLDIGAPAIVAIDVRGDACGVLVGDILLDICASAIIALERINGITPSWP